MKLKKLAAIAFAFSAAVCAFPQVNLKSMSADELIELKASIEKELFARRPEAFVAAQNPLEGLSFSRKSTSWGERTQTVTFGSNGTLVVREEWSSGRSAVERFSYSVDAEHRIYSIKKDGKEYWFNYGGLYIEFDGDVYVTVGAKFSPQDAKSVAGNTYSITERGVEMSIILNKDGTFTEKAGNEVYTSIYFVDAGEKLIFFAGDSGWEKGRYTEDSLTMGGKEGKKK